MIVLKFMVILQYSLHGIILAEVYGVPAIMLDNAQVPRFKYCDWYYSTERYDFPVALSVEEALSMKPVTLPKLSDMAKKLLKYSRNSYGMDNDFIGE